LTAVDQLQSARHWVALSGDHGRVRSAEATDLSLLQRRLRDACLAFCLSLLDQCLRGNVFNSFVVTFLSVLRVILTGDGF
jgi:hypothetical protein